MIGSIVNFQINNKDIGIISRNFVVPKSTGKMAAFIGAGNIGISGTVTLTKTYQTTLALRELRRKVKKSSEKLYGGRLPRGLREFE